MSDSLQAHSSSGWRHALGSGADPAAVGLQFATGAEIQKTHCTSNPERGWKQ